MTKDTLTSPWNVWHGDLGSDDAANISEASIAEPCLGDSFGHLHVQASIPTVMIHSDQYEGLVCWIQDDDQHWRPT